jgi:hypothetical protein
MTKRILISAMAVFALTFMAKAQDTFQVGLKAGFNSSQYSTNDVKLTMPNAPNFQQAKSDWQSGGFFGAYARLHLTGNLSLQPELYYIKKSGDVTFVTNDGTTTSENTSTMNLYSWDVPILAHFKVIDLKAVNIFCITGPVLSFNAKDKSDLPSGSVSEIKNATWAYQLGAGVEFWRLNLDVRYEWGLSNVSEGATNVQFNQKTDMLTFGLGFRLLGL